uniref:dihydrodipicolinate reductase C-terminal domain-containing protein n=1 Tax=Candidatus Planktophila sp. TaxID=2175601 RepID=UPI004049D28B
MNELSYLPKVERVRVGLVGFGKTGRAVASVLLSDKTIDLVWVVRKTQKLEARSVPEFLGIESDEEGLIHWIGDVDFESLQESSPVDVIVDFSSEEGMDYYGDTAAELGITIVSAISSLPKNRIDRLIKYGETTRVLWSPNITIGINFLIIAAQTLQKIAPYADISILEEHFKAKPETSGTAMKIAEALEVEHGEIKTVRAGGIIGVHEVLFGFPFQTVRIKHESISREAFGNGAKFALKELQKRDVGFFKMEDLIGRYFVEVNRKFSDDKVDFKKSHNQFFGKVRGKLRKLLKR